MNLKKWLKTKPIWLRNGIIGGTIYPLLIVLLLGLSWISSPIGLNIVFETIQGILLIPTIFLSDSLSLIIIKLFYGEGFFVSSSYFITLCTNVLNPADVKASSSSFRFCFTIIPLLFALVIGFLLGAIIGKIKSKNPKILVPTSGGR